jgi:hypothetical protein
MSAKDIYHDVVVRALEKDGWRITDDPYRIPVGRRNVLVDLGAEKVIAAEREDKQIAVEIKSFQGESEVHDLEVALGQYLLYRPFVSSKDPERRLYLAVPREAYQNIFDEPIGRGVVAAYELHLLIFDPATEGIFQWIPTP